MIGCRPENKSSRFRRVKFASLQLVGLASLSLLQLGCGVSAQVTTGDAALEQQYKIIWHRDVLRVRQAAAPLAASGTSPGVCNVGGSKQACYETSEKVASDLQALLNDLDDLPVPPRYRRADQILRIGLSLDVSGFRLRNNGIASGKDADFQQGNLMISQGVSKLQEAYSAYPADSRPDPAPA